MYSIVETLMKRDGISREEAEDIKKELRNQALAYVREGKNHERDGYNVRGRT